MIPFINLQELLLLISALITATIGVDYCAIGTCTTLKDHTMCKYPFDTIACPRSGVRAGLTAELRKAILDRHNMHRQTVARGEQSPQPPASNMMKMRWHVEAARIAQRWANQCVTGHDSCRNLENLIVGQNIGYTSAFRNPDIKGAVLNMIDSWYSDVRQFDKDDVDRFVNGDTFATYTQLVWAETTAVGCGLIQKPPDNDRTFFTLVCNYVPTGNIHNQRVYQRGKACSGCPAGANKCSKQYPGLCTHEDDTAGRDPKDHQGRGYIEPSGKDYDDRSGRDCSDPEDMSYRRRAGDTAAFSDKPSVFVLLCLLLCVCWFQDVLLAE